MRMIPATPHGTNSQAEKKIFDLLRRALPEDKKNEYTAYHSLNLTRHAYKRFGEIDFLICSPNGLFVLEVKGGGVSCKDGYWSYTNRFGEVNTSAEGPFNQAESALHGLRKKLEAVLPSHLLAEFAVGYGVLMPDCEFPKVSVEWDPQLFADKRRYKDFDHWLKSLIRYWRNKDGKNKMASVEALRSMRDVLRPDVEAVIPLYAQLETAHDCIDTLTEDQLNWVDVVEANPRVLCSGGAGTGKTFLAIELARRWTFKDSNVALLCKSPWLKSFLQSQFPISGLTVSTVDGLSVAMRRQGIDYFDAVIVDEGQDLLDIDSIDKIDNAIKNGLSEGQWCFFHDINNQSGLLGTVDHDAFDYLKSLNPAIVPLNTNCRNTRIILDDIKTSLSADMGVRGAGDGPDIHVVNAKTKEESVFELTKVIDEVIKVGGLSPGQLTILSPNGFKNSIASSLPESYKSNIKVLDEYSFRTFPGENTSFSTIANFKGLENDAIVVVDLISPDKYQGDLVNHYVGMSRAKSYLAVIWSGYE
ncbi:NERD domain-containing protein [Pseudomonadales bacterium]|nr:NERD domain-containing protein [Pseudomonadales bacterium]